MAANRIPGKYLTGGKELYLFIERNDIVVILAKVITISLDLLCPGDHQAEVGRFGLALSSSVASGDARDLRIQAHGFEKCLAALSPAAGSHRSHKFRIHTKLVEHASVLTPHRTVYNRCARSFGYRSSCPDRDSTIDDRQSWSEKRSMYRADSPMKLFNLERKADAA